MCETTKVKEQAACVWRFIRRQPRGRGTRLASVLCATAALALSADANQAPLPFARKSCVYLGRDAMRATVREVHANRDKFAATGLDGIVLDLSGRRADGKPFLGRRVMASHAFARSEFEQSIPLVREILKTKGLSGSFMAIYWMGRSTCRIGWVDDAAWAQFTGNMRLMCALAKELGFKGLFIDHEDYTGKPLFRHRRGDDPPYEVAVTLARQRGAETARAMAAGDPNCRFLVERALMQLRETVRSQTSHESAAAVGDLWYPFLNGFVEAMPPGMRLIEGCEGAYGANTATDYRAQIGDCRVLALEHIEPHLRAKYLAQSEMSFGKYFDGWLRRGLTVDAGVTESLFGAGACCDHVFWVYGEKFSSVDWGPQWSWYAKKTVNRQTWAETFPGLPDVLRVATGDYDALRAKAAAGTLTNLVSNAGVAAKGAETRLPPPFLAWAADKKNLSLIVRDPAVGCAAPGAVRIDGRAASLTLKVKGVKPNDRIYATFAAKGGARHANFVFTHDGAWQWRKPYQLLAKPSQTLANGWTRYECALVAPADVDGAGFIFSASANDAGSSPIWIDDVAIYKW